MVFFWVSYRNGWQGITRYRIQKCTRSKPDIVAKKYALWVSNRPRELNDEIFRSITKFRKRSGRDRRIHLMDENSQFDSNVAAESSEQSPNSEQHNGHSVTRPAPGRSHPGRVEYVSLWGSLPARRTSPQQRHTATVSPATIKGRGFSRVQPPARLPPPWSPYATNGSYHAGQRSTPCGPALPVVVDLSDPEIASHRYGQTP
jgi:hypothetical protein